MSGAGPLKRLPTESWRPMVVFAQVRLGLALTTALMAVLFGFPYGGSVAAVVACVAVPWSLLILILARRRRDAALNPAVAIGDLTMLAIIALIVPEAYGPVRFLALALLAVHAHFQGERIGIAVALFGIGALVVPSALSDGGDGAVEGERLAFYEATFAAATLMTVALVGRFRTEESASRLRARELTRRTLKRENEVRRKLSEALHDGPVQELIGLDMTLASARYAAEQGDQERAAELLHEAGEVTRHNIRALRDEMLDLGPYAYKEISFESAVERCVPVWERRFQLCAELDIEPLELPPELEGELFRITQEAVTNAGRHGEAATVRISLTGGDDAIELIVTDDGKGFGGVDPLGPTEAGHIGLASIRERADLMDGTLQIESTEAGSEVRVRAPNPPRGRFGRRPRPSR